VSVGSGLFDAGAIVLVIFVVVVVHEAGHFVFAKLSGVKVDEFAIGFGPRIVSRTWGETVYAIRAVPFGGFVRMAGMLGLEGESDAGERNFYRASIPKRFVTIAAGVVFNFVFAAVCLAAVNMQSTPAHVTSSGAAARAGLRDGDLILSVDGRAIRNDDYLHTSADLHRATSASKGQPMQVVYRTPSGAVRTTTVTPELVIINASRTPVANGRLPQGLVVVTSIGGQPVGSGDPAALLSGRTVSGFVENPDGSAGKRIDAVSVPAVRDGFGDAPTVEAEWLLGIQSSAAAVPLGLAAQKGEAFGPALRDGFLAIPTFISATATGIYQLVTTPSAGGLNGPHGLSGPVGIAQSTITAANSGGTVFLFWIGFISMNLGLVNLLPIPFLDGGKLVLLLVEAVRRRRLDPRHEALAYAIGLALVALFAVYVTIGDVSRL
jgi:regulator of sigma E protease